MILIVKPYIIIFKCKSIKVFPKQLSGMKKIINGSGAKKNAAEYLLIQK